MKQALLIRWAEVFDTQEKYFTFLEWYEVDPYKVKKSWRDRLIFWLHNQVECFMPQMPNKRNADYRSWKIRFEKYLPYIDTNEETIIVVSSLWWTFILKRLSENSFPKKIAQLHLVCPASSNEGLIDENIADFEFNFSDLPHLVSQCEQIFLYHSTDDHIVPYTQSEKLAKHLPGVIFEKFDTRWHFYTFSAFPELLDNMWIYKK